MKKLIFLSALFLVAPLRPAFANPIVDQFQVALLGHVETVTEMTTRGETVVELLGTPIQIGQMAGDYLVGIDGGVLGNVAPQPGQGGFDWTAGIHFHLAPLIRKYIAPNISPDYPAIKALEINPRFSLTFENGHKIGTFGFAVGYAFALTPQQ